MNTKNIYGIKDRFHPIINGNNNPEVRSDNPAFNDLNDFFHGVNNIVLKNQKYIFYPIQIRLIL